MQLARPVPPGFCQRCRGGIPGPPPSDKLIHWFHGHFPFPFYGGRRPSELCYGETYCPNETSGHLKEDVTDAPRFNMREIMNPLFEKKFIWSRHELIRSKLSFNFRVLGVIAMFVLTCTLFPSSAGATLPGATIEYQPMTSEGLAAGYPFEAWVVFNVSSKPETPGLALPEGATFRFTFPSGFTAQPDSRPQAVLLYGWSQGPIQVPFTIGLDPQDSRTMILKLNKALPSGPPERPGLKAIHLRWGPRNPSRAGDYPIAVQLSDAGALTGTTQAIAHITPKPVPNIAAYNQLHDGRNEDWQHVRVEQAASLPIDLLVTLPDKNRSFIALRPGAGGDLDIIGDGAPIGKITRRGVPVTLKPQSFGPGFARLGIVRFYVTGGSTPGMAEIDARLEGGTRYTIHVFVEP